MSRFDKLSKEDCDSQCIYKEINKNFYFLNCDSEEPENEYEIPKGVRIVMFCYSGKILNVCNAFDKFNWSNILLNPDSSSDYCNFLSAISDYSSINDDFSVYEEGDTIKNINLYSENTIRQGVFKLPVKGFFYDKKTDSIIISSNTPMSSIVRQSELKRFFKDKSQKIIIDDNKIVDLMKKNKNVSIIESYVKKIHKSIKLSNLINSMKNHGNFTMLLMVCKNGEENRSFSNGRVIKDEVIKMKSQILLENILKH